jgi:hypothetical protein
MQRIDSTFHPPSVRVCCRMRETPVQIEVKTTPKGHFRDPPSVELWHFHFFSYHFELKSRTFFEAFRKFGINGQVRFFKMSLTCDQLMIEIVKGHFSCFKGRSLASGQPFPWN